MSRIEPLSEAIFQPLPSATADRVAGGAAAVVAPAATFERYVDVLPDGTIAYSYVQVD